MKMKQTFLVSAMAVAISTVLTVNPIQAESQPQPQPTMNSFWWPDQLDLRPLRQNSAESNPLGKAFNYAEQFKTLNLKAVKEDIANVLHTSQPWWPADYGNYGPLFIRMAWHSAGVYRIFDGRGGASGG